MPNPDDRQRNEDLRKMLLLALQIIVQVLILLQ